MNWPQEIAVMALVKSEIAKADRQKLWPYALPRVAAQPRQIAPIAATIVDLDLFAMIASESTNTGEVIWFAGTEIQRFRSFGEFFLSMADYNRRELASLRGTNDAGRAS